MLNNKITGWENSPDKPFDEVVNEQLRNTPLISKWIKEEQDANVVFRKIVDKIEEITEDKEKKKTGSDYSWSQITWLYNNLLLRWNSLFKSDYIQSRLFELSSDILHRNKYGVEMSGYILNIFKEEE